MIIKKSIKTAIVGLLMIPALALGSMLFIAPMASALTPVEEAQNGANSTGNSTSCLFTNTASGGTCANGIFTTITNTALFIIGALSVLMLIYGGIRYTISMGDSKNVEAAKNTIMYAIIGIVVALLAGAIVNFVLGSFIH